VNAQQQQQQQQYANMYSDSAQFLDKRKQCRQKLQNIMKLNLNNLPKLKPQFT
jgi:hypothetical protein